MTFKKFITKLNWRQVVIHFIAAWFFMYSFQTLAILHDTSVVDIVRQPGKDNLSNALSENKISATDLTYFTVWMGIAASIGLLIAFGISIVISIRRKWFWFNSFLALVLVYILSGLDLLGWTYLKKIFLVPGLIFKNITLEFLINGLILLTLGFLAFFLPGFNKFIARGDKTVSRIH